MSDVLSCLDLTVSVVRLEARQNSRSAEYGRFADKTFRRQTLRRQCRTFRRYIQLHKDRIPRHRHPRLWWPMVALQLYLRFSW